MAEQFDKENFSSKDLAKHLKKPSGKDGKKVGLQMNKGNKYICLNSYRLLSPKSNDRILEIGMGNGFFVENLLMMGDELSYVGVDFSQTMVEEASDINKNFSNVSFYNASIEKLPFVENEFDCITTTNTVYFWPDLVSNLRELKRVLKPGGKLLIAYRDKKMMDHLEFTQYGFDKYSNNHIESLLLENGFSNVQTEVVSEPSLEFEGKEFKMEGLYTTGIKM